MKRSPLKRRTPLRSQGQGSSSDSTTRPPMRRNSPLAKVSPKRRRQEKARRECVDAVIARDGGCQFWHHVNDYGGAFLRSTGTEWHVPDSAPLWCSPGLDVHEPAKRSHGADPTNPDECICLCRAHHDWVHASPKTAEDLGLLLRAAGFPISHVNPVEEAS